MKKRTFRMRIPLLAAFAFTSLLSNAQPNFINEIPIPDTVNVSMYDTVTMALQIKQHQYNPNAIGQDTLNNGYPNQLGIQAWAYNIVPNQTTASPPSTNNTLLGPTLIWETGDSIIMRLKNELNQPTTTHWHGAQVPAKYDGGPHQPFWPGNHWDVAIKNYDSTSTCWYHPHYHNNTYPQVQLGLSGLIISRQKNDPIEANLPSNYGVDDIPLIIGDLRTKTIIDPNTGYIVQVVDTAKSKRPTNIVNGVTNPYVEVPAHLVRLRILNGSTRKGIQFGVSDNYTGTNLENFVLVATDGGHVMKPDTMQTLRTGPGARAEIVLDLTNYIPGDVLYLRNLKKMMPGSIVGSPNTSTGPGNGKDSTAGNAFLELRIIPDPLGYSPVDTFTPFVDTWDPSIADTTVYDRVRKKTLEHTPGVGFTINGDTYEMMRIDDTVCVNTKEVWEINNISHVAHPFHIHKIFFRILSADSSGHYLNLDSMGWNGPKDDVLVPAGYRVRFLAAFDSFPGPIDPMESYMYHCHILTHEDVQGGGMMHQFVVTDVNEACWQGGLGLEQLESNDFLIFPNPAKNQLFMKASSSSKSTLRIVNLNGQLIRKESLAPFDGTIPISLDGMNGGFYIIEWTSSKGTVSKKLLLD